MTSDKLDLDPIQALILEAFWAALAQLDSASALPAELREEINQVGEALANHQVDAVVRLFTDSDNFSKSKIYSGFNKSFSFRNLVLPEMLSVSLHKQEASLSKFNFKF